jgi:hypothetical protein
MKTKPTIPGKLIRIFGAILVAGNMFFNLATPQAAQAATAPGAPTGVNASPTGDSIIITWSDPESNGESPITGWQARIRLSGDSMWSSMWVQPNLYSVTFSGLTVGEEYDIAVAAINDIGTGPDTEVLTIMVGDVPYEIENLQFVDNGDGVLRATWDPPTSSGSTEISSYDFAYSLAGADSWDEYNVLSASAMITGLNPALYDIRVRANNSIGSGDWTYLNYQYLGEVNYNIATCEDLQNMRNEIDAVYNLVADIDCTGVDFEPVGTPSRPFIGSLIGHGYTISNLTIATMNDYAGLFGAVEDGYFSDMTIIGSVSGGNYSGGLIGYMNGIGTVSNVHTQVTVVGANYSGGLIGYASGPDGDPLEVTNSSASGNVTGGESVGGLIGYAVATQIITSHATGDVTSAVDNAGGLIGASAQSIISRSYATGDATSDATRAGGLIGDSNGDTITDSYARGDATTPNIYYAGGLIGAMHASSLTRVYSSGVVNGYGIIGGLVGFNLGASSITDSFSASYVLPQDGGWDTRANNGLVGIDQNNEIIYNNVFFNSVNANPNCTRDNDFNIITSEDCTGINSQFDEDIFTRATDAPINTWDFDTVWQLNDNDYPTLLPSEAPYILCEQATVTNTTIRVACTTQPDGWGTTTWEMQYKKTNAGTWNDVSLSNPAEARATITGLVSGTEYQVRFRFTNNWGISEWGRVDATTTGTAPVASVSTPASSVTKVITVGAVTEQVQAESAKIYLNDFSEYGTSAGKTLELALGQVVYFYVRGELHSAAVIEIGPDYVILRIASEPQEVRISLGETQEVSVSPNGSKDIRISLKSLQNGKATLNFAEITEPPVVAAATKPIPNGAVWWLFLLIIPVGYYLASHKAPRHA